MAAFFFHSGWAALYAGVAVAGAIWTRTAGYLSPTEAVVAAGGFFLLNVQIHGGWIGRRRRQALEHALARIDTAQKRLNDGLELVREEMSSLTYTYESTARLRTERLVSEVRVLEDLIGRLDHAGPDEASDPGGRSRDGIDAPREREGPLDGAAADMLEAIRTALEDNRVDLHLQPIVSLPQRRLRFFEALTRLRDESGGLIMPAEYLPVAEEAGLISVIDNLLLFRSVQIVRRLPPRDRHVALMCNISARTLKDTSFFNQFLDFMEENRDLSHQIIFEFAQDTVDHAGPEEMAHLGRLADMGFRLSMDNVANLDVNPSYLQKRNFRFVKIPADLLLDQRAARVSDIDTADLKALFRRHGVDLIVEKIENERTVVEILEYDVDYGQGYLFGAPRPIRDAYTAG